MRPASRRLSAGWIVRIVGGLTALTLTAGLLVAGLGLPMLGVAGVAVRDAAKTFSGLQVPALAKLPSRSEILDSHGGLIAYYYPNHIYRVPVPYGEIAPAMRHAIIAIEDDRFYQHGALDIRGTLRAVATDLTGGQVQGGSTLAQQYVKNALLLSAADAAEQRAAVADDVARKIRELRIAANVEHQLTPSKLLAAYLNVAYFENEAYGVEVAAQRYFRKTARTLTVTQSALLAGLVQNPSMYDPLTHPAAALARRNLVLGRMAQLGYLSRAAAARDERAPLGLRYSPESLREGCQTAGTAAWFCDYAIAELRTNPAYGSAWQQLNTVGGLKIVTTMNPTDQEAAQHAVSYMVPAPPSGYNPGGNAAAEVLMQPGTGHVEAIAVDRPYGTGAGQDSINYAVDSAQDGGAGVQTGSSSKLFTLITALKRGIPFGSRMSVSSPSTISPYYNCQGRPTGPFRVWNAEGAGHATYSLYTGTTDSINVFFARLEQRVGLCAVVRTAVSMGDHRANGTALLKPAGRPGSPSYQLPADDLPSFTLGSVNVSPMTMAAAYATVPARGIYCHPIAIREITSYTGAHLPVASANCRRVFPRRVAAAVDYILRGVLTSGTAKGDGVTNHGSHVPQAGKTGTANSFDFAAFGGYTPKLAGYVSMFNPRGPVNHPMVGSASCYRASGGGSDCPGSVFGANAGQVWQLTFENADLGSPNFGSFPRVPGYSGFFSKGTGQHVPSQHGHHGHHGHGRHHGHRH